MSFIQSLRPGPRLFEHFRNKLIFYGELLAPRPTPKLEDDTFSAIRNPLFSIFAASINEEVHNLYSSPSIIRMTKSSRMRSAGRVARIGEERNAYRILMGKPEGKGQLGRARRRW
jgi:hypothetical protein